MKIGRKMMFQKPVKWRSKKYLKWVKSLQCDCGAPADDAHHIQARGLGKGTSTKVSDCFIFPRCRSCHTDDHANRDEAHEMLLALRTIEKALNEGVLS